MVLRFNSRWMYSVEGVAVCCIVKLITDHPRGRPRDETSHLVSFRHVSLSDPNSSRDARIGRPGRRHQSALMQRLQLRFDGRWTVYHRVIKVTLSRWHARSTDLFINSGTSASHGRPRNSRLITDFDHSTTTRGKMKMRIS